MILYVLILAVITVHGISVSKVQYVLELEGYCMFIRMLIAKHKRMGALSTDIGVKRSL